MSTPYGPVDPNIIALNRQAREQQQQREAQEQARQAELARQRQEEERRQRERERRESAPARRVENIHTGRGPASIPTEFDSLYEGYVSQGYDPRDAFSLASARASQAELAREGKVFTGQTLYITDDSARGFTEYKESKVPAPLTEQEVFQQLAKVQEGRKTPIGTFDAQKVSSYVISRDAGGEIIGYGYSTVRQQPDYGAIQQQLKAEQLRMGQLTRGQRADDFGIGMEQSIGLRPSRIEEMRGDQFVDVGAVDRNLGLSRTSREVVQEYSVGVPAQKIGLRPSSTMAIEEAGSEGFSRVIRLAEIKPIEQRVATAGTKVSPIEDVTAGFQNYMENVPKGFQQIGEEYILRQSSSVKLAPEIEGSFFGAVAKAGKDVFTGQKITLGQDLGQIGREISDNPFYAAGSLAGSVAFTVGTLGIGSAARGVRTGVSAIRDIGVSRRVEASLKVLVPDIRGYSTARAVEGASTRFGSFGRILRRETETPSGFARFDVGTETSTKSPFIGGAVNIPKREVTLVTREALAGEELAKVEPVAKYVTQIRATETTGLKQSLVKGGDILDLSTTEMLPKTIKSAVPDIPILSKSPVIRFEKTAFEGLPRAAKEPVAVASALTYDTGDIIKFARATGKENQNQLRGSQIDEALGLPTRKSKPFDYPEQVTESITPGTRSRAVDAVVSDLLTPETGKGTSGFEKFLTPAAASRSLGLGGDTGAERAATRGIKITEEEIFLSYPPESRGAELTKTLSRQDLKSLDLLKPSETTIPKIDSVSMTNVRSGFGSAFKFDLGIRQVPSSKQRLALDTTPLFTPLSLTGQTQRTRQPQAFRALFDLATPRVPRPIIPRPPRIPLSPVFPFATGRRKGKGKRKRKDLDYSEFAFDPIEIFPGTKLAKTFPID